MVVRDVIQGGGSGGGRTHLGVVFQGHVVPGGAHAHAHQSAVRDQARPSSRVRAPGEAVDSIGDCRGQPSHPPSGGAGRPRTKSQATQRVDELGNPAPLDEQDAPLRKSWRWALVRARPTERGFGSLQVRRLGTPDRLHGVRLCDSAEGFGDAWDDRSRFGGRWDRRAVPSTYTRRRLFQTSIDRIPVNLPLHVPVRLGQHPNDNPQLLLRHVQRRRDNHVVARHAVGRAPAGIQRHAQRKGPLLHRHAERPRARRKRPPRRPVRDELDGPEQPAPAHVADVLGHRQRSPQLGAQPRAPGARRGDEAVAGDDAVHGQRRRASDGVRLVRVAVVEARGAAPQHLDHALVRQHRRDGRVPAAQPLAQRHQVRPHVALGLKRKVRARPPAAAHDLVQDEQHAVVVAHAPHARQVAPRRRDAARRRAAHRLGDEGYHRPRPDPAELVVQLPHQPRGVRFLRLVLVPPAVVVRGAHEAHVVQQQRAVVGRLAGQVAAHAHGADRVPVVGLPPRDEPRPRRVALLHEVLPRELQRRVRGLAARPHQVRLGQAKRLAREQGVGQLLGAGRGVGHGVHVGDARHLLGDGSLHLGVPVADDGDGGARAGVEDAGARRQGQVCAAGRDDLVRAVQQGAVQQPRLVHVG
ncbi:hypothetical protein S40288_06678 [Stachybotrys chartarum IBT 40288]|nr:hypothetical protein S40288_06678 [Stachybotrys chartarum IBT 40288]